MDKRFNAIVLYLLACPLFAAPTVRLDAVMAALRDSPAHRLPERYFDCSKYKGTAYEAIATGDAKWVALAEQALEKSDACYTESLHDALGDAMWRHPENVLPLVGKTKLLTADDICLPFISDEIPVLLQKRKLNRSRVAISRAINLPRQRDICLAEIDRVEKLSVQRH